MAVIWTAAEPEPPELPEGSTVVLATQDRYGRDLLVMCDVSYAEGSVPGEIDWAAVSYWTSDLTVFPPLPQQIGGGQQQGGAADSQD